MGHARRRLGVMLAFTTMVVVVACVVWSRTELASASSRLEEERAAAVREGVTIDYRSLHPAPVPNGENGTDAYVAALRKAHLVSRPTQKAIEPFSNASTFARISPRQVSDLRKALVYWASPFKALDLALKYPHIVFDRPYEKGPDLMLPEFTDIRHLQSALVAKARLQTYDHQHKEAFQTLDRVARAVAIQRDDPIMVSHVIRAVGERQLLVALRETLFAAGKDADSVKAARRVLADLGDPVDVRQVFRSEAAFAIRLPDYFASVSDPSAIGAISTNIGAPISATEGRMLRLTSVRRANETHSIEFWRDVYRHLPADGTDYVAAEAAIAGAKTKVGTPGDLTYRALRVAMIDFSDLFQTLKRALAWRRVTNAALTALELRARSGNFPRTLPTTDKDPFDGAPLRYRPTPDGFVVYSIGPDRRDNGGVDAGTDSSGNEKTKGDLVFRYREAGRSKR